MPLQDRVSSGSDKLDQILGGGMPVNGISAIMGLPGSGKTILAQQYLFHNATSARPGIYLTTVSEPLEKVLHYAQALDLFRADELGKSVFYEDAGRVLNDDGLPGILGHITGLLLQRNPGILVIDSFKALRAFARDDEEMRRFLHELAGKLSVFPVTSLWVGEYGRDEIAHAPEFAVADAILALSAVRSEGREMKVLEILKLRGSSFLGGQHAYRIRPTGLDVFPRLADPVRHDEYSVSGERRSSGVPLLDTVLHEGYWPGSSTMVAGPSGSGKTLLGLHFIFQGADEGDKGVIATLQENPTQLDRIARGYGWNLNHDDVDLMYRTPVDLYLDEWVHDLLATVEESAANRVLIDSLGDLEMAARDEVRFREYVYSLLQRFSRSAISVVMTQEVPQLFGITTLSEKGVSHLADNVILLQYLRGQSRIRRAVSVIKTRASSHDADIREFEITSEGFELGEAFTEAQDLT
jgi:circadian clock protein KaiC